MNGMLRVCTLVATFIVISACTRMPTEYREQTRSPIAASRAVVEKMLVVGSATIGIPTPYVDQDTGLSGEIVVESEYFSANGRLCRRYTEKQASFAAAYSRLGCLSDSGWVEIPVDAFAG